MLTEARIRELLGNSPLFDAGDYAALTAQANADPHEGAEWLPHYKLALGVMMHAAGMLETVAHTVTEILTPLDSSPGDTHTVEASRRLQDYARQLVVMANAVCAIEPGAVAPAITAMHEQEEKRFANELEDVK